MQRKKKSKRTKSARPSLQPEEETLLTSLLRDLGSADASEIVARIPDPHLAQIFVERLPLDKEPDIRLLSAFHDSFEDKRVRRAVKRALFKLKKKGTRVEEFYAQEGTLAPILKPAKKEKPAAYIGPVVDSIGSRAVFISLHKGIKGQDMALGLVSDEEGIHQFLYGRFSKKRMKEMKDYLSREVGPLVETSLSHVTTVLEEAYQRHLELQHQAPPDYLEIRPWLQENVSSLDRPVIYNHLSETYGSEAMLTHSQLERLFEHNLMKSWLIDFERLKPFMEDILKTEDSPIVLTEVQKSDRVRHIKEEGIKELFPANKLSVFKRRFEEMAYVFLKLDEEEYSRISLVASQTMNEEDSLLSRNQVIEFLFDRSVDFYMDNIEEIADEKTPEDEFSPRIILP